jgi:hypothetical protein
MNMRRFDLVRDVRRFDRRNVLRFGGGLVGLAATSRFARSARAVAPSEKRQTMVYQIDGKLLEVCTCGVLCPCWVGEDPDGGTCDSSFAWHIDKGTIEGVDVAGLTLGMSVHIPGNVHAGNWKAAVFVDDKASKEQEDAMLKVFTGQLGGGIADLAALIGDVVSVERMPISFQVDEGNGTLTIGDEVDIALAPFKGATGEPTALHDSVFTTIPGSPAFVGKASKFQRNAKRHGMADVDITDHNAIQGLFHFEA